MPAVKDAVFVLLSEHAKKFLGNGGMKLKMQLIFSMCDFLYMLTSFLLMEELLEMGFFSRKQMVPESLGQVKESLTVRAVLSNSM